MTLVAEHINKRFGSTVALQDVSIALAPNEVHALVGENGAGKSTLLRILAGAERPDDGAMRLADAHYAPHGTRDAERHGVALVHQEITINPSLTVAENIFIDRLSRFTRYGFMQRKALERAAQEVLDSFDAGILVSAGLGRLDLGQWKCIEIARALSHAPRILFLDEATAFLGHREVDALLTAIHTLKSRGLSVAFVSHHLSEVTEVADRLTILKDGKLAGSAKVAEITPAEIHARMVGRDISGHLFPPKAQRPPVDVVLGVQGVSVAGRLDDVRLDVHGGEIVGLAGLKGSGGEALLELAMGVLAPQRGALALGARAYAPKHPDAAWRAGVAYLPGDRTGEGLIADFSVLDNVVMARPPQRLGWFDAREAHRNASELGTRLKIKAAHPDIACRTLSGGNLQKVVLAKCLHVAPRLLLLNNPTRGVDIGARIEIYRVIRALADEGVAVLLVSDDLPELIGLSDRLAVMRGGRIEHTFAAGDTPDETTIVRHMT
ncbi:sugar ABC transporter ATP-binding protein [Paraburkholderia edwinii]|uniref:Sugar ABC transporter ATP-binding protein n=1 Tax=Paraburkholderia edwinii TaxID=2861782 RepID=A0ABX8UTK2_9BURK|nr:sugar ABC transporter ATP-binding protein [Paraburkholderia edwinii]QYD72244.1 sugar ABC transporter ATP-binding protein [Paraburkholderia edwinii]